MKKNIAIVGAGIGGMSAAYDLARAGHDITIYEAGEQVGGLASGFKEPHWIGRWRSTTITGSPATSISWD